MGKDIFTLNNIVEFSPHATRSMSKAEHGGPNWKCTQTRLLKKKHKASYCSYFVRVEFIFHGLIFTRIAFLLHPISYLSELLWNPTSQHGIDEERMNTKIKRILTKYIWSLIIIHLHFIRNMWISSTASASVTLPFTYRHILTLLTSNLLLSMMIASLVSVIQLSLSLIHTFLMKLKWIIIKLHTW